MNKIKNDFNKRCSPNMMFNTKIIFRKIKFTLKTENVKFLTSLPQVVLQDIKKSFEGAD